MAAVQKELSRMRCYKQKSWSAPRAIPVVLRFPQQKGGAEEHPGELGTAEDSWGQLGTAVLPSALAPAAPATGIHLICSQPPHARRLPPPPCARVTH